MQTGHELKDSLELGESTEILEVSETKLRTKAAPEAHVEFNNHHLPEGWSIDGFTVYQGGHTLVKLSREQ